MRVAFKLTLIVGCILVYCLAGAVAKRFRPGSIRPLSQSCYRALVRIIGLRYDLHGAPATDRPLLVVSNHSTYLDILLLGALLPIRFTPKSEIGKWPGIGAVCRLTDCIFIDRRVSKTAENNALLLKALEEGAVLSLFPEGTTNQGNRVLPFRSSYFSLASNSFHGKPLAVQPVAITYTHVRNLPMDSATRHRIAWYGDMELVPHLKELLKLGAMRASVTFFPPVDYAQFADRKDFSAYCQSLISEKVQSRVDGDAR